MKITYISASIIPSERANSVNVMKMANALAKNGHEVILVGTQGKRTNENIYQMYNVDQSFDIKLSKNTIFSSIYRLYDGIKYSFKAEVVYTRWIVAAAFLIMFTNKKLIYEYHAPLKGGLLKFFEKKVVKSNKVKRHIFITKALQDYFLEIYPVLHDKDLKVLPDGADFVPKSNIKETKKEYDCIYVGSFQEGKGVDLIVDLANRLSNIKFAIVGGSDNEVKQKRKSEVNGNISWFGHLSHQKVSEVLQKAEIALLPNQPTVMIGSQDIGRWTSPMKLFEYMAHNKPIIASNIDVLKEILVNEHNSLLVNYNDHEEWEAAIKKLLTNKKLSENISNNSYIELNEKYTWQSRANRALSDLDL